VHQRRGDPQSGARRSGVIVGGPEAAEAQIIAAQAQFNAQQALLNSRVAVITAQRFEVMVSVNRRVTPLLTAFSLP
jgi:hypothetical protein